MPARQLAEARGPTLSISWCTSRRSAARASPATTVATQQNAAKAMQRIFQSHVDGGAFLIEKAKVGIVENVVETEIGVARYREGAILMVGADEKIEAIFQIEILNIQVEGRWRIGIVDKRPQFMIAGIVGQLQENQGRRLTIAPRDQDESGEDGSVVGSPPIRLRSRLENLPPLPEKPLRFREIPDVRGIEAVHVHRVDVGRLSGLPEAVPPGASSRPRVS